MPESKWFLRKSRGVLKDGTVEINEIPIHLCSHPGCNEWGSFLIGARWMHDIRGTAYCRQHLPDNEVLNFFPHAAPVVKTEATDATEDRPDGAGAIPAGDH